MRNYIDTLLVNKTLPEVLSDFAKQPLLIAKVPKSRSAVAAPAKPSQQSTRTREKFQQSIQGLAVDGMLHELVYKNFPRLTQVVDGRITHE